jgi:plastocyanin
VSKVLDVSNVSRRKFLVAAGSVAAASSIAAGNVSSLAAAPTRPRTLATNPVTIDVTTTPISYTLPGTPPQNAYRVKVQGGDKVTWKVKTSGANHRVAILFLKDSPFVDSNQNPVYAFEGSQTDEGGSGIGGNAMIDTNASGTYEYYVAVFDDVTHRSVSDDPKIIVGSGNLDAKAELIEAAGELKQAALSSPPAQREKIRSIENKLEELIEDLK